MELKEILTNYRAAEKISQRELARRCGLSNSLISILEMGVNPQTGKEMNPDMDTLKKIADGMGITMQSLFMQIGESGYVSMHGTFTEDEYCLVSAYRLASDEIKSAALTMLEDSAAKKKDTKESAI